MGRRVSLPAADHLFRRTTEDEDAAQRLTRPGIEEVEQGPSAASDASPARKPSGRVRHDEKMTVYVTADELVEIERARLTLRSRHGLVVDRGRLVREAVAMVLADLESDGEDSRLVQRLNKR